MKNFIFTVAVLSSLGFAAGCAPTTNVRGNILEDYQISEVRPGVHTKKDVMNILGSPTTIAPFDESHWYYLGQRTETRGIMKPEIIEEKVYSVTFNEEGYVDQIQRIDTTRNDIPVESRVTPTSGNEVTVLQQLIGNVGKFRPPEQE